jgi:hypothetical protein
VAAVLDSIGGLLARYPSRPNPHDAPLAASPPEGLAAALEPCDVLLVEGNTRFSTASATHADLAKDLMLPC